MLLLKAVELSSNSPKMITFLMAREWWARGCLCLLLGGRIRLHHWARLLHVMEPVAHHWPGTGQQLEPKMLRCFTN